MIKFISFVFLLTYSLIAIENNSSSVVLNTKIDKKDKNSTQKAFSSEQENMVAMLLIRKDKLDEDIKKK